MTFFRLTCFVALMSLFASLSAQSCQRVMAGLSNVFNGMVQDYLEFRGETAKTFVEIIIPGKTGAETSLTQTVDAATQLQLNAYQSYGIIPGEGDGKIGPRHLVIPTRKATGTLGIERTFEISNSPYDKVYITVHKTGGKGGADIAACVKYTNGSIYHEKRNSIGESKSTSGEQVTFTFFNMENDKIITLHLVKTGLPTDNFEYYITVEGEFNEEKLVNLYQSVSLQKKNPSPIPPTPLKKEAAKRVASPKVRKNQ